VTGVDRVHPAFDAGADVRTPVVTQREAGVMLVGVVEQLLGLAIRAEAEQRALALGLAGGAGGLRRSFTAACAGGR
jgi:hypothetical protein